MDAIKIDQSRTEALSQKILDVLNGGTLGLMISIGHRTGLFDTMAKLPPSSSYQIAEKAGLNERYVREWLGAMTVSGIVEFDYSSTEYYLPPEHSAILTRDAGADNFAVYSQYLALLGSVEDKIVECFKNGGGVPYSEFNRFHEVMAEDSGQTVLPVLLDKILPLIPGMIEKLIDGIDVLDVGCGRGKALHLLAKNFPESRFEGYDLSEEAIDYANRQVKKEGLTNIKFFVKDLTEFDLGRKFDFITTFDAVHDQKRPDHVLKGIYDSLKDDGYYLMQDISGSAHPHNNIDHPMGTFLYTVSTMHCMTVSLAQGGLGLGTFWGRETALKMLDKTGFKKVEIKNLPHDIQNDYYIIQK
jgi:2-polyprenyl-3-methyl-5-hydroxy-6-metoxy-1,4-benzoquinol methylase